MAGKDSKDEEPLFRKPYSSKYKNITSNKGDPLRVAAEGARLTPRQLAQIAISLGIPVDFEALRSAQDAIDPLGRVEVDLGTRPHFPERESPHYEIIEKKPKEIKSDPCYFRDPLQDTEPTWGLRFDHEVEVRFGSKWDYSREPLPEPEPILRLRESEQSFSYLNENSLKSYILDEEPLPTAKATPWPIAAERARLSPRQLAWLSYLGSTGMLPVRPEPDLISDPLAKLSGKFHRDELFEKRPTYFREPETTPKTNLFFTERDPFAKPEPNLLSPKDELRRDLGLRPEWDYRESWQVAEAVPWSRHDLPTEDELRIALGLRLDPFAKPELRLDPEIERILREASGLRTNVSYEPETTIPHDSKFIKKIEFLLNPEPKSSFSLSRREPEKDPYESLLERIRRRDEKSRRDYENGLKSFLDFDKD